MTDLDKLAHEIAQAHKRFGEWVYEDMVDAIRAALLTAPPGWKLVPVEPTQEMLDEVCSSDGIEPWTDEVVTSTYRAMIAAAPEVK